MINSMLNTKCNSQYLQSECSTQKLSVISDELQVD